MWQIILKNNNLTQGSLILYLQGTYSLERFIQLAETFRKDSVPMYRGLIDLLKNYQKDKYGVLRERNLQRFPNAVKKMNALVREMDLRERRDDETPILDTLNEAFQTARSDSTSKNLMDFAKLYRKYEETAKKQPRLVRFFKDIKSDSPYVVIRFKDSSKINVNDEKMEEFAKETGGKYENDSIFGSLFGDFELHYENMDKIDDWVKAWNTFSKNPDNKAISDYIKEGKPEMNIKAEAYSLPEEEKYTVNLPTTQLRAYFSLIDDPKVSKKRFIPSKMKRGESQISLTGLRTLLGVTGRGKSYKFNPFIRVLIDNSIISNNWFSVLMRKTKLGQIISSSQLKNMVQEDILEAVKNNRRTTLKFGIDSRSIEGFDEATTKKEVSSLDISNVLEDERVKLEDYFSIKEETKNVVESAIELGLVLPSEVKEIKFSPSMIEGEYIMEDEGDPISSRNISKIFERIAALKTNLEKRGSLPEELNSLTLELQTIENFVDSSSDFSKLFMRNDLGKIIKTHQFNTTRLSSFTPEDLIKFFYVLDKELGAEEISIYYIKLDKLPILDEDGSPNFDREDEVDDLEEFIGNSIEKYRQGIAEAFSYQLSVLLSNGIVSQEEANRKGNLSKLPQNIFNELMDRSIIRGG